MTLQATLDIQRASGFRAIAGLTIDEGEVVGLLGPNGAGKTTVLRALAGLLPITSGRIEIDGVAWDEPPDVFVRTEDRHVGVVFDDYRLFAHLSALDNVAFGLRSRGCDKKDARRHARDWLDRVGLSAYANVRPSTLSAGQTQRVALARALAPAPRVLLLDEPLAAVDASTRGDMRAELAHHIQKFDGHTLLVTHDPLDAIVLSDRLVIIEDGRVVQTGTPNDVARRPRTDYVARLVGLNLYRGRATGTHVALDDGGDLTIAEPIHGAVYVVFAPSAVSVYPERAAGSPRNTWPVTVAQIEQHAHTVRVQLDGSPSTLADVTPATVAELNIVPGRTLWASLKATETHAYPA